MCFIQQVPFQPRVIDVESPKPIALRIGLSFVVFSIVLVQPINVRVVPKFAILKLSQMGKVTVRSKPASSHDEEPATVSFHDVFSVVLTKSYRLSILAFVFLSFLHHPAPQSRRPPIVEGFIVYPVSDLYPVYVCAIVTSITRITVLTVGPVVLYGAERLVS